MKMRDFRFIPWIYLSTAAIVITLAQTETVRLFWKSILTSLPPVFAPIALAGFSVLLFHLYGLIVAIFDYFDLFASLKQHKKDKLGYFDLLPQVLWNNAHVFLSLFIQWYIFNGRGFRITKNLPGPFEITVDCIVILLLFEVGFYFGHRLLHTKMFYPVHALHHKVKGSVGISGMYNTTIDFYLTTVVPSAIALLTVDPHLLTAILISSIASLNSIHSHSAYLFPGFPSPEDHLAHHLYFNTNYGIGPLDLLLGTDHQTYLKQRKEIREKKLNTLKQAQLVK